RSNREARLWRLARGPKNHKPLSLEYHQNVGGGGQASRTAAKGQPGSFGKAYRACEPFGLRSAGHLFPWHEARAQKGYRDKCRPMHFRSLCSVWPALARHLRTFRGTTVLKNEMSARRGMREPREQLSSEQCAPGST